LTRPFLCPGGAMQMRGFALERTEVISTSRDIGALVEIPLAHARGYRQPKIK